jgi:hypothetical protein
MGRFLVDEDKEIIIIQLGQRTKHKEFTKWDLVSHGMVSFVNYAL